MSEAANTARGRMRAALKAFRNHIITKFDLRIMFKICRCLAHGTTSLQGFVDMIKARPASRKLQVASCKVMSEAEYASQVELGRSSYGILRY